MASPKQDEVEDDIFENFDQLLNDLDVVDEVGSETDNEEAAEKKTEPGEKEKKNNEKKSKSKEKSRERDRHRSSRNKSRSRSPAVRRHIRRSPIKRRSPVRRRRSISPIRPNSRRSPDKKKGAAAFLEEMKQKFGAFPELDQIEKEKSSRPAYSRSPMRGNSNQRSQRYSNNNNGPPNNQMMNMNVQNWGPQYGGMPMPGPSMMYDQPCPPGVNPMMYNQGFNPQGPMMPMQNNMQSPMPGPMQMPMQGVMQMPMGVPMQPSLMSPDQSQMPMPVPMPVQAPMSEMPLMLQSPRGEKRKNSSSRSPSKRGRSRSRSRETNGSTDLIRKSPKRSGIRTNIDLSEITSQLLMDDKINLSDYFATKANSAPTKTLDARSHKSRVLSKCKAALHTLEHAADDIQFETKFLCVPPKHPADTKDPIGSSPLLPTKKNPVFRISAKDIDQILKCRPYSNITRNTEQLILRLGLDESVISKRLEPGQEEPLATFPRTRTELQDTSLSFMKPNVQTAEMGTQTPALECKRCDLKRRCMMNISTQTERKETYCVSAQTTEIDFIQAKLRLKTYTADQKRKDIVIKKEFAREIGFEYDDGPSSERRIPIAPPGFRDRKEQKKEKNPDKETKPSRYELNDPYLAKYPDKYYAGSRY